jgi:hypothetical protein
MKKYHPDIYLENLEKDKTIKEGWYKSLRTNAAPKPEAAPAAQQGDE